MIESATQLRIFAPPADSLVEEHARSLAASRAPDALTQSLDGVLRATSAALGMSAAALYVLDDDTTTLDLRAGWQLPVERFAAPPRVLAESTADLEAMCGHAVALEDTRAFAQWNIPEESAAALCLPVSGASLIHGTMWLFDQRARGFSDRDVLVAEIAAGRLAAELERAAVGGHSSNAKMTEELARARQWQRHVLPHVAPHSLDWDISGWTAAGSGLAAGFHDWCVAPDEHLALIACQSNELGLTGALAAAQLRATWRAIAEQTADPAEVLSRMNASLWSMSPGDQLAHAAVAVLPHEGVAVRCAVAGEAAVLCVAGDRATEASQGNLPLGLSIDTEFAAQSLALSRGDILALADGRTALAQLTAAVRGMADSNPHDGNRVSRLRDACRTLAAGSIVALGPRR